MSVDRRDLRRRLFHLCVEQGGYFTAAQARSIGYSYQAQAHHVAANNWYRIDRGIFRLVDWIPEVHDDLIRWSLWSKDRAVISHETALAVHEIGEFESPRVQLTVPHGFTMTDRSVRVHFADLLDSDIATRTGFRVTTVERSLIDMAARHADQEQLARAIDEARQRHLLTIRQLRTASELTDVQAALNIEKAIQLIDAR